MLIFILPLSFLMLFFLCKKLLCNLIAGFRETFLASTILFAFMLLVGTELLSLIHWITPWTVFFYWAFIAGCAFFLVKPDLKKLSFVDTKIFLRLPFTDKITWIVVIFILLTVGLTAIVAPPNNYDSMTYHMSRVMHWIQNHSVGYYQTKCIRQLIMTPLAEYGILHLQILSGTDRFANLVQWFALLGCIGAVSLIGRQLGASSRGQAFSALFAATIPMAILQGSSTQNDLVASFFAVASLYFLLKLTQKLNWKITGIAALSIGLGVLAKATSLLVCLPFILIFALKHISQKRYLVLMHIGILLAGLLVCNAGYYLRNNQYGGNIISPHKTNRDIPNEAMSPKLLVSNTVRNLALHLGTKSQKQNEKIAKMILSLHNKIGVNIHEPKITFLGINFSLNPYNNHEDTAGNPYHLYLGALGIIFFLLFFYKDIGTLRGAYLLGTISAFILFCATTKWQPWHSRMHLPFFMSFAAFTACLSPKTETTFSYLSGKDKLNCFLLWAMSLLLFVQAMPPLFKNNMRPLISKKRSIFKTPRKELYFAAKGNLMHPYTKSVDYLKSTSCQEIGLLSHGESWEYPLWMLFGFDHQIRMENIMVTDPLLQKYPIKNFHPCAVISVINNKKDVLDVDGFRFLRTRIFGVNNNPPVDVYLLDEDGHLNAKKTLESLNKTLELSMKTTYKINNDLREKKTIERTPEDFMLMEDNFDTSQTINMDLLKQKSPETFAAAKKLVDGIIMRNNGYRTGQQQLFFGGHQQIQQALKWFMENQNNIRAVLKP